MAPRHNTASRPATGSSLGERRALAELCRRLYGREILGGAEGSASVRSGGRILITPGGVNRGALRPEQILAVEDQREGPPELGLHRLVYQSRPDVRAVLWAQPAHAVALAMAKIPVAHCLLPGAIYEGEGRAEEEIALGLRRADILFLERHGAVVVGADLEQAGNRLEALARAAQVTHLLRALPAPEPLGPEPLARVLELGRRMGLPRALAECDGCGGCGRPKEAAEDEARFAARVSEELRQKLPATPPELPRGRRATCGEAWWLEPE
jgi:L-fuculose-phosphate aldolase